MKNLLSILLMFFLLSKIPLFPQSKLDINNLLVLKKSSQYQNFEKELLEELSPIKEIGDSLQALGMKAAKEGDNEQLKNLGLLYLNDYRIKVLEILCKYPDCIYSAEDPLIFTMQDLDSKRQAPKLKLSNYRMSTILFHNLLKTLIMEKDLISC